MYPKGAGRSGRGSGAVAGGVGYGFGAATGWPGCEVCTRVGWAARGSGIAGVRRCTWQVGPHSTGGNHTGVQRRQTALPRGHGGAIPGRGQHRRHRGADSGRRAQVQSEGDPIGRARDAPVTGEERLHLLRLHGRRRGRRLSCPCAQADRGTQGGGVLRAGGGSSFDRPTRHPGVWATPGFQGAQSA